jgi:hypothetical protein
MSGLVMVVNSICDLKHEHCFYWRNLNQRDDLTLEKLTALSEGFGRYALPFESGPATWVSDVNVSYTRKALDDTQHLWKDRFTSPSSIRS